MKQLKIRKSLWELILKGEKTFEFRKLSKGLESGIYEFREIKNLLPEGECSNPKEHRKYTHYENGYGTPIKYCRKCNWQNDVYETFGTAKLIPIAVNPKISGHGSRYRFYTSISNNLGYSEMCVVDKDTYDFVKENYIDKGVDFIAYEILRVKNATN